MLLLTKFIDTFSLIRQINAIYTQQSGWNYLRSSRLELVYFQKDGMFYSSGYPPKKLVHLPPLIAAMILL